MKFSNSCSVEGDADAVLRFLRDVPRSIQCMPGTTLVARNGQERYSASIRVRIAGATLNFRGEFELTPGPEERSILFVGHGNDVRGSSGGSARVTVRVEQRFPGACLLTVDSSIEISGRLEQLGRPIIPDLAERILLEFTGRMEAALRGDGVSSPPADDALDLGAMTAQIVKARASNVLRGLARRVRRE